MTTTKANPLGSAQAPDDLFSLTDAMIEAGFQPADATEEMADDYEWIEDDGYYAFRLESNGSVTLVSDSDRTLKLTNVTVQRWTITINTEARFDATREGAQWFVAALNVSVS